MNILNTGLGNDLLEWSHAWVMYRGRKYPMFQVRVMDTEGLGQMYQVLDASNQTAVCTIQLTSTNLAEFLEFIEAHRHATRTFATSSL